MKILFVKYAHPTNPNIRLTVKVEREPEGEFSIRNLCVEEKNPITRGIALKDFEPGWIALVLRKLGIDHNELNMEIEDALEKDEAIL